MSATPPPGYTPPPADLPQRGIRATFSALMDTWITWFSVTVLPQVAALANNVYLNTVLAFDSANTASAQAAAAVAAVDALPWAAGTYAAGAVRYSPADGRTYRCYVGVTGSTDPANDRPHWVCISAGPRPYLQAQDQKASGASAGTATATTWNVRTLNTVVGTNTIPGAALASNQITLPAGSYEIQASAPAVVLKHKLGLYNTTDAAFALIGLSSDGSPTDGVSGPAALRGRITITGTKVFELQHYASAGGQLGTATGSGQVEVYADIQIWKID